MTDSTAESPARQVAALCYRTFPRLEILLVTSRETRRWVTPKGWPMAERTDSEAAAQEAFEEAGVEGVVATQPFGYFGYDKTLKNGNAKPVLAALYSLEVRVEHAEWPERKQRARVWFTIAEAADAVREEELADLIRDFGLSQEKRITPRQRLVRAIRRLGADVLAVVKP